jgi:hypothetical protein
VTTAASAPPHEVLHDDSALWDAVYAAAWVSSFWISREGNSFSDALQFDHAHQARQIADAAVAQLRRPR